MNFRFSSRCSNFFDRKTALELPLFGVFVLIGIPEFGLFFITKMVDGELWRAKRNHELDDHEKPSLSD